MFLNIHKTFKKSSYFERGVIVENNCLIQYSLFDVRIFLNILASHCLM